MINKAVLNQLLETRTVDEKTWFEFLQSYVYAVYGTMGQNMFDSAMDEFMDNSYFVYDGKRITVTVTSTPGYILGL